MMKRLLAAAAALALYAAGAQAAVPGNVAIATPAAPTGPTTTTLAMMGIGTAGEFTPREDGIALITISGTVANGTASDGAILQVEYGTGSAPANAATFTGSSCGAGMKMQNNASTAAAVVPFSMTCIATGMQLGTPYWIDMAAAQVTGGTVTFGNLTVSVAEQ